MLLGPEHQVLSQQIESNLCLQVCLTFALTRHCLLSQVFLKIRQISKVYSHRNV